MAKVTFEFDDKDESLDIKGVVGRNTLIAAVNEINELYRNIYNEKIYDKNVQIYVKSDGCVATDEDYENVAKTGELLKGGKQYLDKEWVEKQLEEIIDNVKEFLYYY